MSAFITTNATIDNAVECLMLAGKPIASLAARNAIRTMMARNLMRMNEAAVNTRYSETNESPEVASYKPGLPSTDIFQIFKSTECLIYQCSEGDVVNRPLYKKLEKAKLKLEAELKKKYRGANFGKRYDAAAWDVAENVQTEAVAA